MYAALFVRNEDHNYVIADNRSGAGDPGVASGDPHISGKILLVIWDQLGPQIFLNSKF